MRTVKVLFESIDKTVREEISLSFSEQDDQLLRLFQANFERFNNARLITKGIPRMSRMAFTAEGGWQFEVSEFDYGDLCEFLHVARPIFLADAPASFQNTCSVFGKQSRGNPLAKHLKHIRMVYSRGQYQPYFQVKVDGIPLFHESTVMDWLNGVEYHQDEERRQKVKQLEAALGEGTARSLFVAQLSGRIAATTWLADMVNTVMPAEAPEGAGE